MWHATTTNEATDPTTSTTFRTSIHSMSRSTTPIACELTFGIFCATVHVACDGSKSDAGFADERVWLTSACSDVFDFLIPLEDYFSFPGQTAFSRFALVSTASNSTTLLGKRCDWCG